jgi:chromosome segregation ATPase
MNAKSPCWCSLALTVGFLATMNLRAQTVDDTGGKWRLEQAMREEARLISSGKTVYRDERSAEIVRGLHERIEQRRRAAELEREDVLLRSQLAKAQEDLTKAREKLDAELKSTQAVKEEMAKALANSKTDLAKIIADKSAAFMTLQKTIEERDDEINELKKEVNRLQDAQVAQKKKWDKRKRDLINQKELGIDSLVVLVLVFVLVLAAVPWEMWISASPQPPSEG